MTGVSEVSFMMDLVLNGDVNLLIFTKSSSTNAVLLEQTQGDALCSVAFHTGHIPADDEWTVSRTEIDGVHKAKHLKKGIDPRLCLKVRFAPETDSLARPRTIVGLAADPARHLIESTARIQPTKAASSPEKPTGGDAAGAADRPQRRGGLPGASAQGSAGEGDSSEGWSASDDETPAPAEIYAI